MRLLLSCLLAGGLVLHVGAQVTINVQLPPAGLLQKDQLWNLVVVNNSNGPVDMFVELQLQDAVTGQQVLTGGSPAISFSRGIRVVTPQDVQPVQYNIAGSGFSGNYLPLGSFIACYRVSRGGAELPEVLAEECVPVHIQPLSPPLLHYPLNLDTIPNGYPQFTWMAPAPTEMFSNLNYEILLAEVLEGQSPSEAILYNSPVFTAAYLTRNFEPYPASQPALDTGKLYAWQVVARNEYQFSAQTEVWTFRVASLPPGFSATAASYSYLEMKDQDWGGGLSYIRGHDLHLKVYLNRQAHEGEFRVTDMHGNIVQTARRQLRYGNNYLHIPLDKKLQSGSQYRVTLRETNRRVYSTRFIIQ